VTVTWAFLGILNITTLPFTNIQLIWWPLVSLTYSIGGLLFGSLWIFKPFLTETKSKIYSFFISLTIFAFRMLSWQFIILEIANFSLVVIVAVFVINAALLYMVQSKPREIDSFSLAALSIVLPMCKLPSKDKLVGHSLSINALTLLVTFGNVLILICIIFLATCQSQPKLKLQIGLRQFYSGFGTMVALFFLATIPSIIIMWKNIREENNMTEKTTVQAHDRNSDGRTVQDVE
jgi:hypothetical protein